MVILDPQCSSSPPADVQAFLQEPDPRCFVELGRTKDWAFLTLNINSKLCSEVGMPFPISQCTATMGTSPAAGGVGANNLSLPMYYGESMSEALPSRSYPHHTTFIEPATLLPCTPTLHCHTIPLLRPGSPCWMPASQQSSPALCNCASPAQSTSLSHCRGVLLVLTNALGRGLLPRSGGPGSTDR